MTSSTSKVKIKMTRKMLSMASLLALGVFFSLSSIHADQAQMQAQLVQVIEQLQQIKPLIAAAYAEEPVNLRDQVHLKAFIGSDGQMHNGVSEDLDQLQAGIEQIINQPQIDPKTYAPISGDYVGSTGA